MTEQELKDWKRLKWERADLMANIDAALERSFGAPPRYAGDVRRRIRELDSEIEWLEGERDE